MAVNVGPKTCILYNPTFLMPVIGSFVWIIGRVKKGPPSSGQHFKTGNFVMSGFVITTSWHSPLPEITLGIHDAISLNCGSIFNLSIKLFFGLVNDLNNASI